MKNEWTNDIMYHLSFVENFSRQIREKEKKVKILFFFFIDSFPYAVIGSRSSSRPRSSPSIVLTPSSPSS